MVVVWVPAQLRDVTQGRQTVTVPGATVRQVIEELERLYSGVRDRLIDGDVNEIAFGLKRTSGCSGSSSHGCR